MGLVTLLYVTLVFLIYRSCMTHDVLFHFSHASCTYYKSQTLYAQVEKKKKLVSLSYKDAVMTHGKFV